MRADPRHRPEDRRAAARAAGSTRSAKLAAAPPERARRRGSARGFGAALQRRARFEDDAPVTEERKVVSESRETTFDYDIADPAALEQVLERLVEQLCAALVGQRAPRAHDRDQGPPRRLLDPHPRAHAGRAGGVGGPRLPVALDLLRRFARAAAGAPAGRAGGRAGGRRRRRHAEQLTLLRSRRAAAQYSALASRRRDSRASGLSTPSSSRIPTTTRRMSSLAPSALGSAPMRRSSARS